MTMNISRLQYRRPSYYASQKNSIALQRNNGEMVLRSSFGENGRATEQAMMYVGVVLTTGVCGSRPDK
jgi:hypothetical protein